MDLHPMLTRRLQGGVGIDQGEGKGGAAQACRRSRQKAVADGGADTIERTGPDGIEDELRTPAEEPPRGRALLAGLPGVDAMQVALDVPDRLGEPGTILHRVD